MGVFRSAVAVALFVLFLFSGEAWAQSPIQNMVFTTENPPNVFTNEDEPGDPARLYWGGPGTPNAGGNPSVGNRILTKFQISGEGFTIQSSPLVLTIRRVNNARVTGRKDSIWAQQYDDQGSNYGFEPELPTGNTTNQTGAMEACLNSRIVNRGSDNTFCNFEGTTTVPATVNNVEALDYILPDGISSNVPADIGFVILERGGNDPAMSVRPILSLSGGAPASYGPPVLVGVNTTGDSFASSNHAIMTRDNNELTLDYDFPQTTQNIYGTFFSFSNLGINPGQTFYGYSVFPNDNPSNFNPVTLANASTSTNGNTGLNGGHDLVAGGMLATKDSTVPVTVTSLQVERSGDSFQANWSTASEEGIIGFQLQSWSWSGPEPMGPIVPSHLGDSATPQNYGSQFTLSTGEARRVRKVGLVAFNRNGEKELFGPFTLGRRHTERVIEARKVDWEQIGRKLLSRGYLVKDGQAVRVNPRRRWLLEALIGSYLSDIFAAVSDVAPPSFSAKLGVEKDGFYRLTYDDLASEGVELTGALANQIALTRQGRNYPVHVENRGRFFGPGSSITFYAEGPVGEETRYLKQRKYELKFDPGAHVGSKEPRRRPKNVRGGPQYYEAVTRVEKDVSYFALCPSDDPWVMSQLVAYSGRPASTEVVVDVGVALYEQPSTLKLGLVGVTDFEDNDSDHHVAVYLNDEFVGDGWSDGLVEWNLQIPLAAGVLMPEENRVRIEVLGDTGEAFDAVYLDHLEVHAARPFHTDSGFDFEDDIQAFQVTGLRKGAQGFAYDESGNLHRLSSKSRHGVTTFEGLGRAHYSVGDGSQFLTPEIEPGDEFRLPPDASGVDLVVVTHSLFAEEPELLSYLGNKSISTRVVTVEDIYASETGGEHLPQAIRKYLSRVDCKHVLLVGADSYDYLDYGGQGSVSFVPTLYTKTNEIYYHTPSDGLLVDFDGDEIADRSIGRWPVRSVDELKNIVKKSEAYNSRSKFLQTALVLSDYEEKRAFSEQIARVSSHLDGFLKEVVAVDAVRDEFPTLSLGQAVAQVRQTFLSAIGSGVQIVLFDGHGSATRWSNQGLLTVEEARALQNSATPSVFVPLACYTTSHNSPGTQTLAHHLMTGEGGAAVILGASALSDYSDNESVATETLRNAMTGTPLGEALVQAKRAVQHQAPDAAVNWEYLGDPSLCLVEGGALPTGRGDVDSGAGSARDSFFRDRES